MSAYILVDVKVTDAVRYENYKRMAEQAVMRHGGRYLVRGGETVALEGDWRPNRIVVLEFPSLEHIKMFYKSAEYVAAAELRKGCAEMRMIGVSGV
ncbi:MAG TPA: DUF1330 domain-containing protein [Casimicrobiaceae bacterium]|nr:DUF1330 domain-containing protein [Casimicrobiaceae bacterium]